MSIQRLECEKSSKTGTVDDSDIKKKLKSNSVYGYV